MVRVALSEGSLLTRERAEEVEHFCLAQTRIERLSRILKVSVTAPCLQVREKDG
jgi:hypothetical protein